MIRHVAPKEAAKVFGLMSKVYAHHSFLDQGLDAYQQQLREGSYVSLGDFEGPTLRAHAGYRAVGDFALINSLVVDPGRRGEGLGRQVFDARLTDIESQDRFKFIVGYSMMQHLRSQRLYGDAFKPIGLDIGYPDIYHQADSRLNRGSASNAELVLCRKLAGPAAHAVLSIPAPHRPVATQVVESVGATCEFRDEPPQDADIDKSVFLGFHPDARTGLFTPAYLDRAAQVDFGPLLTSNETRREFVQMIREGYERVSQD